MQNEKRLIDANALMESIYDTEYSICCPLDEVSGVINDAPTVDAVEVVHAEWIEGYSGREKYRYYLECSDCGFYFKTPCEHEYQLQDYKKDFEHCPCCCAIMDGGNEDG